eukprot:1153376-Pelagomonas_calceolata.AAC.3
MEPGASNNPPDPQYNILFVASWWRGFKALLSQCVPFSLIDVGKASSAYVVFLFFSVLLGTIMHIFKIPFGASPQARTSLGASSFYYPEVSDGDVVQFLRQDSNQSYNSMAVGQPPL